MTGVETLPDPENKLLDRLEVSRNVDLVEEALLKNSQKRSFVCSVAILGILQGTLSQQ
jgi:hypothetical protein